MWIVKQRRRERIYNRTVYLNGTFYEKGEATEHMRNDRSYSGHFDYSLFYCDMVEMTGVEPVSENIFTPASTSVDCVIRFPSHIPHNQVICYGSF